MIGKTTTQHVLEYFFLNPTTRVHLRELSRQTGLSMPTIITAVTKLEKEGFVNVERGRAWTFVTANRNRDFLRKKRLFNLAQLYESGLVDALIRSCHPQAIICFGSYSRGEDTEESDIDIAIINGKDGTLPETFEQALRRPLSLHHPKMSRISKEFRENLRNGVVLDGAW